MDRSRFSEHCPRISSYALSSALQTTTRTAIHSARCQGPLPSSEFSRACVRAATSRRWPHGWPDQRAHVLRSHVNQRAHRDGPSGLRSRAKAASPGEHRRLRPARTGDDDLACGAAAWLRARAQRGHWTDPVRASAGARQDAGEEHSTTFRLALPGSGFVHGLGEWRIDSLVSMSGTGGVAAASAADGLIDVRDPNLAADAVPETVLTRGLHEITSLLVTEYTLDDILRVILETIYRALGVGRTRAFFLLKDPSAAVARFRFGFGQSAPEMRAWTAVSLSGVDDVFSLVMRQYKDLVIKNVSAPEVSGLLPEWYRQHMAPRRYLVLLPLVVDQKALGFFYIDGDE